MEKKCPRCGAALIDNARYCHQCGGWADSPEGGGPAFSAKPLAQNVAAALCYSLGLITGIVFLNLEPYRNDPQIRFHAWHSIYFSLAWVAISALHGMMAFGFFYLWFLAPFVNLAFTVLWIILMVKAYNGEKFELPWLGELAHRQASHA